MFFKRKFDKTMQEVKHDLDTRNDIQLLDVREVDEYKDGHIKGALLLPLGEVEKKAALKLSKQQDIYVYCRSGQRSNTACKRLRALGYTNVYNIGGIMNWPFDVVKGM
ncbi:MAG: rhodanese-like domain-containing protein [Cellulosilyticaceae bacterium]